MTKQEIINLIASKIKGQGSAVDVGSALPAILNGILELIPTDTATELLVTIEDTGTVVGQTTTYDVTNTQASIDAFIAAVESKPEKALAVVKDGDALIRFTQIEVSDTTVTATAQFTSGKYTLHLISTDGGGNSYFSYTASSKGLNIFDPTVTWEYEPSITAASAATKYGLTSAVWDKFLSGEYNATTVQQVISDVGYKKILPATVIDTECDDSASFVSRVVFGIETDASNLVEISKNADGTYTISAG